MRLRPATGVLVGVALLWAGCNLRDPVPVSCERRDSRIGQGQVVIVRSHADKILSLWIETEEKKAHFTLQPRDSEEFGWLEGFHFGENTSFTIGGEGYASVKFAVADLRRRDHSDDGN